MPKNLINLSDLDPAVAAAMGRGDRRQADAHLPKDQRARQAKERAKVAARNRFVVDLDPDLQQRLEALAAELRCPASGLVNLAIDLLLTGLDQDQFDIRPYLAPSKSMRYDRTIKWPSQESNNSPPRDTPRK